VKPASLPLRVLAFLVDLGLWSAATMVILAVPGLGLMRYLPLILESQQTGMAMQLADAITFLVLALLFVGLLGLVCVAFDIYCYTFEKRYGATLGKGIFGLCVRDAQSGEFPTRRQCVVREVTRPFEVGGVLPAILAIVFDSQRRRLGDRWAGTVVAVTTSKLGASSFPWTVASAKEFREATANGFAPFWRRATACLGDIGIVCLILSPIDLLISAVDVMPAFAEAFRGNYEALSITTSTGFLGWFVVPVYCIYAYCSRVHFGATIGEKVFGIRREASGNAVRAAVVPWLLLPLTFLEGAVGTAWRRSWRAVADRASGTNFVSLTSP